MHRNTIPFKVAAGYCAVAVVLLLAIALVYSNTKSIFPSITPRGNISASERPLTA